jgi:hypothetical protein
VQANPPSGYNIVQSTPVRDDGHERSTAILIVKRVHYEIVNVNIDLQITVVKLFKQKVYTVCSLYLPHNPIRKETLTDLITQLPAPFLILGDMNAKSPIWGNNVTDERGNIFEKLLLENNICILNDNTPTHFHIQTGSHSSIDLSICSSDCVLDFEFSVLGIYMTVITS